MKIRDKKLAVLRLLGQEGSSLTLKELLGKLNNNLKERTVRRWLDELVQEGLVEKTGLKRGMKYRILQKKNGTRIQPVSSCFSSQSLNAVAYVRKPLYERSPASYSSQWADSYTPNTTFYLSQDLRDQLHQAGNRATNKDPAGTYAHQIFNRLLIDLSFNSSRLEGNTYSLLDTERLIISGQSVAGKLDEETVMILNHKEAIRYLVENSPRRTISLQTLFTIHYLLSDGLLEPQYSGKIRDHFVRISGSTYLPLEGTTALTRQLEKVLDKARTILDPFEQSLFLLAHLSYLQVFTDVNKRTARLCSNIPLIIQNLVPLSFNDIERSDYMTATIAIYELQDIQPMIDLFVFSYMRTCAAYDATVKVLGYDEVRVRYRHQRRTLLRKIISQKLDRPQTLAHTTDEAQTKIPHEFQQEFIEDVLEDLEQMDDSRLAGLGITPEQLQEWSSGYTQTR